MKEEILTTYWSFGAKVERMNCTHQKVPEYWTEQRRIILKGLAEKAKSLSELYEFSVDALYGSTRIPGWSRLVSHSIREIGNRLPDVFLSEKFERSSPEKNLEKVLDSWRAANLDPHVTIVEKLNSLGTISKVEIPISTLEDTRQLLVNWQKSLDGSNRKARRFIRTLSTGTPQHINTTEASIGAWLMVLKWSVKQAHDAGRSDAEADLALFRTNFEIFENHLFSILSRFFNTIKHIDAALLHLNEEKLDQLLGLILLPQHQVYFFENLKDPCLLKPLVDKGFFKNPPISSFENSFSVWPPVSYLIKVASAESAISSSVIKELPKITNPYICDSIAKVCLNLPSEYANQHTKRIVDWYSLRFYVEMPELVTLLVLKFCSDKFFDSALKILKAWLKLSLSPNFKQRAFSDERILESAMGEYSFGGMLQKCIPVLLNEKPSETILLLVSIFHDAICIVDKEVESASKYDWTKLWWRDVSKEFPSWNHAELSNLAVFLRNLLVDVLDRNILSMIQVLAFIQNRPNNIFRRLELYLISRFPKNCIDCTTAWLVETKFMRDDDIQTEYRHALRAGFVQLCDKDQNLILSAIQDGPDLDKYKSWQIHTIEGLPTLENEEEYRHEWKNRWLAVLSSDPQKNNIDLDEDSELERIEWSTEEPILNFVDKDVLSIICEIKNCISTKGENYGMDWSIREALLDATEKNPIQFISNLESFSSLGSYYLAGIVSGFSKALRAMPGRLWNERELLSQFRQLILIGTGKGDEELKFEIIRLLQQQLEKNKNGFSLENQSLIWSIIDICGREFNSIPRVEISDDEDFDIFTVAFNDFSSMVVNCAIVFTKWQWRCCRKKNIKSSKRGISLRNRQFLERALRKNSKVLNSVFAVQFVNLCVMDKLWATELAGKIFEPMISIESDATKSFITYVSWNSPRAATYQLLKDSYQKCSIVLRSDVLDTSSAAKSTAYRRFAGHLIQFFAHDVLSLDDILKLLPLEDSVLRPIAMEVAGEILEVTKTELSSTMQGRMILLWDTLTIVDEPNNLEIFASWFESGTLPASWSLLTLRNCLRNSNEWNMMKGRPDQLIYQLSKRFADDPETTLVCLHRIAEITKLNWLPIEWVSNYKSALVTAKNSASERQMKLADDLLDLLGQKGFMDFQTL